MDLTHVKNSYTFNSGGNVMLDCLELSNGKLVVLSDDCVCIYPSKEYFDEGEYESSLCIHYADIDSINNLDDTPPQKKD